MLTGGFMTGPLSDFFSNIRSNRRILFSRQGWVTRQVPDILGSGRRQGRIEWHLQAAEVNSELMSHQDPKLNKDKYKYINIHRFFK